LQKGRVLWKCLVGGAKKWKEEWLTKEIVSSTGAIQLSARITSKENDHFLVELVWDKDDMSFAELLHHAGQLPLPPYLNREVEEKDKATYQTIYAMHDGSVAAPTAGLHFTDRLFEKLEQKHIRKSFVTLHVGAGTFKPVKAATMQEHEMHAEFIDVPVAFMEELLQSAGNKIVCVGTTSLRTVESLYWMGVKLITLYNTTSVVAIEDISIRQWDAYELPQHISMQESLQTLLAWMEEQGMHRLITKTQIIIAPGYSLRIANGLITNFHQPQSTLLLLVAAITGNDWRRIYDHALQHNYRFLSYGDGSLLWKD